MTNGYDPNSVAKSVRSREAELKTLALETDLTLTDIIIKFTNQYDVSNYYIRKLITPIMRSDPEVWKVLMEKANQKRAEIMKSYWSRIQNQKD